MAHDESIEPAKWKQKKRTTTSPVKFGDHSNEKKKKIWKRKGTWSLRRANASQVSRGFDPRTHRGNCWVRTSGQRVVGSQRGYRIPWSQTLRILSRMILRFVRLLSLFWLRIRWSLNERRWNSHYWPVDIGSFEDVDIENETVGGRFKSRRRLRSSCSAWTERNVGMRSEHRSERPSARKLTPFSTGG